MLFKLQITHCRQYNFEYIHVHGLIGKVFNEYLLHHPHIKYMCMYNVYVHVHVGVHLHCIKGAII